MTPQSAKANSGFAPSGQQSVEFVWDEQIVFQQPGSAICQIQISSPLDLRKIYVYLSGNAASTVDNYIKAYLRFFKTNSKVGEIPIFIGNSVGSTTKVIASLPSFAVSGGSPIQDSLFVTFSAPQAWANATAIIQPTTVTVDADTAQLDVTEMVGNTLGRAFLGIRSTIATPKTNAQQ